MESREALPDGTIIDRLKQRTTYLRATEVMALLHATRATVCEWINSGQLISYRLGKNNSVDPADLVTFLQARRTCS